MNTNENNHFKGCSVVNNKVCNKIQFTQTSISTHLYSQNFYQYKGSAIANPLSTQTGILFLSLYNLKYILVT
jgi:hypothetical protein